MIMKILEWNEGHYWRREIMCMLSMWCKRVDAVMTCDMTLRRRKIIIMIWLWSVRRKSIILLLWRTYANSRRRYNVTILKWRALLMKKMKRISQYGRENMSERRNVTRYVSVAAPPGGRRHRRHIKRTWYGDNAWRTTPYGVTCCISIVRDVVRGSRVTRWRGDIYCGDGDSRNGDAACDWPNVTSLMPKICLLKIFSQ